MGTTEAIIPLSAAELTPEQIDNEVEQRVSALRAATETEIENALRESRPGSVQKSFLKAFAENPSRRLEKNRIDAIAANWPKTPVPTQRGNMNNAGVLPNHSLSIDVLKISTGHANIAWILRNTRVSLSSTKVSQENLDLHEAAARVKDEIGAEAATILDCLINQHLGLPLNHLAAYAGIEETNIPSVVETINKGLEETKAFIHIRNGIAIIGDRGGSITIFDNDETRKNLFPQKTAIQTDHQAPTLTNDDTAEIQDLTAKLQEAEERALNAEKNAAQLTEKNTRLTREITRLERDLEEALKIAEKSKVPANTDNEIQPPKQKQPENPIRKIATMKFQETHEIIDAASNMLEKLLADDERGVSKKKVNDLRQAFNGLNLPKYLGEARTLVSKALDKLRNKALKDEDGVEIVSKQEIEEFLTTNLEDYIKPKK